MAKKKTKQYALRFGHPTSFRRTIDLGTKEKPKKVQLVFDPGTLYDLTEEEVSLLSREIGCGLLVEAALDPKGRFRYVSDAPNPNAEKTISALEDKIEKLSAENAELTDALDKLTGDESANDTPPNTDGE